MKLPCLTWECRWFRWSGSEVCLLTQQRNTCTEWRNFLCLLSSAFWFKVNLWSSFIHLKDICLMRKKNLTCKVFWLMFYASSIIISAREYSINGCQNDVSDYFVFLHLCRYFLGRFRRRGWMLGLIVLI